MTLEPFLALNSVTLGTKVCQEMRFPEILSQNNKLLLALKNTSILDKHLVLQPWEQTIADGKPGWCFPYWTEAE